MADTHAGTAELWLRSDAVVWLTPLHIAEWTHAVELHLYRRQISPTDAVRLHDCFRNICESGLWLQVPVPDAAYERCTELGRRYGSQFGLRTLDTLHVACALELNAQVFWTFDERQRKLAGTLGLKVR